MCTSRWSVETLAPAMPGLIIRHHANATLSNGNYPLPADQFLQRLSYALHIMAITQIPQDTSAGYYQRMRAAMKSHKGALRCLKRRLLDVIHRQLQRDATLTRVHPRAVASAGRGHDDCSPRRLRSQQPRGSTPFGCTADRVRQTIPAPALPVWPGTVVRDVPVRSSACQCVRSFGCVELGAGGHVGGEDVVRVPVEVLACPVIPHRGAGVGVAGANLDIPQIHPSVEHGGDESVACARSRRVRLGSCGD
jgi:hypothetical protein